MSYKPAEPVAIVGSGCRFAGDVNSPSELWKLLREPRDVRSTIPESRFNADGWYHSDGSYHGRCNVKKSYLLNRDVNAFDTEFFGMTPVEATATDPQQRLLMETVYEALEAAGMSLEVVRGSDTGVYCGVMWCDYEINLYRDLQTVPKYSVIGTGRSSISSRLSYFFDWHGASVTIDTACSSSLVALHLAVQALRAGDSRMAVACGTNVILGPENYVTMSKLQLLSPDGLSRMWDHDANGYARGDGVTAIVLKTLSNALADGDHVECIIRGTDINHDGATPGMTMPSVSAQQALIKRTYQKAGLDPLASKDQPQYFEAHGTGTPAGDSVEAEAIYRAFCGDEASRDLRKAPLYIGSIKTVLGHTEGSAGIAGVLKASLAVQHGCIPPNLSFNNLSHRVQPFYKGVQILQTASAWPDSADNHMQPRRASVNSFGIGGANAHCILENYDHPSSSSTLPEGHIFTPFVFSAASERSLRANLSAYSSFLATEPQINIHALAWTLRERRSTFAYRTSFVADSIIGLKSKIDDHLNGNSSPVVKAQPTWERPASRIFAVFNGQGAQYARMGAELIERSSAARKIVERLESYLAELPELDRPTWSLKAELQAGASTSRVQEATMSQSLCTTVQILLVDLLRAANITFSAVVGHSSGETAAAYAAGWITSREAIYIAFYRGLHVLSARSPQGDSVKGAMLAVGLPIAEATQLCGNAPFSGRITVAASNSPSSVTLSGDEDAISDLKQLLDGQNIFNRRLFVDRAYHSSHMLPCFDGYVNSLHACRMKPQKPKGEKCIWISSVYNRPVNSDHGLDGTYWAENLTKPVLFSEALATALSIENLNFDLAVEIGPHPALKQPAIQTIQARLGSKIDYIGTLSRGTDAVQAMSTCLGLLWSHLGRASADLDSYERAMHDEEPRYQVIKGLPPYQWNHEVKHKHESRVSRQMRLRGQLAHRLLGDICPDSAPHQMSWRNVLRESEIDWLGDHRVQGQVVFPASGYICTALEALVWLSGGKEMRLVEMRDLHIHHAVPLDQDVEVLISLVDITTVRPDHTRAKFTYSAALGAEANELILAVNADIDVFWGETTPSIMFHREPTPSHMVNVDPHRFYQVMNKLGLEFRGRFGSLASIKRKRAKSSCLVKIQPSEDPSEGLVHPAELDSAFQSIFPAYGYPGNDRLSCLHLPQSCELIRVNPTLCRSMRSATTSASVDAMITHEGTQDQGFCGDINIYPEGMPNAAIQLQRFKVMPLRQTSASDDRKMFFGTHWIGSNPDGRSVASDTVITQQQRDILDILVRVSTFYLRQISRGLPSDHPSRAATQHSSYLEYAEHVSRMVENGEHIGAKKAWLNDTLEDIMEASKPFLQRADIRLMHLVGQEMPRALNNECDMLEVLRASNLLDDYYENGFGLQQLSSWMGRAAGELVDRHRHMKILEIGAGTGGGTKAILNAVGNTFRTYTATDISAVFSENIDAVSSAHQGRVTFKVLDVEKDPVQQGYTEGAHDLIIAFSVLHATSNLERTLRHTRRLLRPGGYLLVGEANNSIQTGSLPGVIFGTLPGWWLGRDDGRSLSPLISTEQWDKLLRSTGFSGIDVTAPGELQSFFGASIFLSQAVDDIISFLRAPLDTPFLLPRTEKLVIVGGQTPRSAPFVSGLKALLKDFFAEIYIFETLESVSYHKVGPHSPCISLTELDKPVFKDLAAPGFSALKSMFGAAKDLLWVTSGRRCEEPFSNMTVGYGRTARNETPELRLQFLDVENPGKLDVRKIAEIFLRLRMRTEEFQHSLWPFESEIIIDAEKRDLVPRLRHNTTLNDRYNSARRAIVHKINVGDSPVAMELSQNGCVFKDLRLGTMDRKEPQVEIRTTHSVWSAITTPLGHKFLTLGMEPYSGSYYLALVPSPASVHRVPPTSLIRCSTTHSSMKLLLALAAAHLVATAVVQHVYAGQTLVVHNPSDLVANAISVHASLKHVCVVFTTDHEASETPSSWVRLPSYASPSTLRCIVPAHTASFVDFSNNDTSTALAESSILSNLPRNCRVETNNTIYSLDGSDHTSSAPVLAHILERVIKHADLHENQEQDAMLARAMGLEDLASGTLPSSPMTVIDWTAPAQLPVRVTSLDSGPLFQGDKTYWIAGLTGALGVSLCDWMIDHGARYLVLTSRNPEVDHEWVSAHERNGAMITIIPCDMTDEGSLGVVKRTIDKTLPPVAGVMNGAAVLRDVSIANMSLEQFNDVTGPKMYASIYLDRLFSNQPLDFFILFSSISCLFGNPGQANYCAANTFVCTLAAQRRKRGLAATALNIGAITGVGYMEREDGKALGLTISKMALMLLSEEDVHQLIAEAIEAGHPDSQDGPELSTGLLEVQADSLDATVWASDPKFADFIVDKVENDDGPKHAVAESLPDMLRTCQNMQDLESVIKRAFAVQLRRVSLVTMPDEELMAKRSTELGLDSLVSVGIRDWFLKTFQVSVAVLKIIGNNTMASLAEDVARLVPGELTPQLVQTKA